MNMNKIIEEAIEKSDMVLVVDESTGYGGADIIDPRMVGNPTIAPDDVILHYSPKGVGNMMRYGIALRNSLQLGSGYQTELVDFGDAISVKISYTNTKTSMTMSQNFIVLFTKLNGQCIVKANSQRYRTCNSPEQAATYIRSKASNLASKTTTLN